MTQITINNSCFYVFATKDDALDIEELLVSGLLISKTMEKIHNYTVDTGNLTVLSVDKQWTQARQNLEAYSLYRFLVWMENPTEPADITEIMRSFKTMIKRRGGSTATNLFRIVNHVRMFTQHLTGTGPDHLVRYTSSPAGTDGYQNEFGKILRGHGLALFSAIRMFKTSNQKVIGWDYFISSSLGCPKDNDEGIKAYDALTMAMYNSVK